MGKANSIVLALVVLLLISAGYASAAEPPKFELACQQIKCGKCGKARDTLTRLAQNGHAKSQTLLGIFYEEGVGIEKNTAKAISWYEKAAGKGLREAENRLGHLYLFGEEAFRDPKKAVFWLEKAADHEVMEAQKDLGSLYLHGDLVTKNHEKAVQYLRRAVGHGSDEAREALESIPGVTKAEAEVSKDRKALSQGMGNIEQSWEGYADLAKSLHDSVSAASQLTQ